jgi:hypothetical protein
METALLQYIRAIDDGGALFCCMQYAQDTMLGAVPLDHKPPCSPVRPLIGPFIMAGEHAVVSRRTEDHVSFPMSCEVSGDFAIAGEHLVAQQRSRRASGEIQREHDQAEVKPITGAAGDHAT